MNRFDVEVHAIFYETVQANSKEEAIAKARENICRELNKVRILDDCLVYSIREDFPAGV